MIRRRIRKFTASYRPSLTIHNAVLARSMLDENAGDRAGPCVQRDVKRDPCAQRRAIKF